jgi:hypothetical protein
VFVPGRPFQPIPILAGKAGAHPSELYGKLLAFLTKIILGLKGVPGTNALAYYGPLCFLKVI